MSLSELRSDDRRWRIGVLGGPNLTRVQLSSGEVTWDELAKMIERWAADLGVEVVPFTSSYEARLLEFVHERNNGLDAYLVNPGGLFRFGESLRHVLSDARRPVIEVHLKNLSDLEGDSIFTSSMVGICAGLGEYSYLTALIGLVLALDDPSFLHPDGEAPTNRKHGKPRSLYG